MKFRKNQLRHLISQNTLDSCEMVRNKKSHTSRACDLRCTWYVYAVLRTAVPSQDSLRGKLFISAHNLSRIYRKKGPFSALLNIPTWQTVHLQCFQPFWAALSSFSFRVMASYNSLQAAFLPPACPRKYQIPIPGTSQLPVQSIIKAHLSLYLAHTGNSH